MLSQIDPAHEISRLAAALPPFPRVVHELLELLRNDELSIETLARVARNDPVIAGQILSVANQVRRLRLQPDLGDPFAATSLIGLNRVRQIVISAGMNRFVETAAGNIAFFYGHSLAVAIVAQELASLHELPPEDAYIAGILHDIGQLCFHISAPELYREVLERARADGRLIEHEVAALGSNHCLIGSLLAEHWHLPAEVLRAIATHHDREAPENRLQAVLMVAEVLARALDLPPSPDNRVQHLNPLACDLLGIDFAAPAMQDCLGRCRARFRYLSSGIKPPASGLPR